MSQDKLIFYYKRLGIEISLYIKLNHRTVVIRTHHRVKSYHKGHKRFMYVPHRGLLYHGTLYIMSNKMIYMYGKRFVNVYVTWTSINVAW